jgi:hypothetical protein
LPFRSRTSKPACQGLRFVAAWMHGFPFLDKQFEIREVIRLFIRVEEKLQKNREHRIILAKTREGRGGGGGEGGRERERESKP